MIEAKEFKETWSRPSYQVSGQTYHKSSKCNNDLDTQMNEFFKENPDIDIINVKYRKGRALVIYKTKVKGGNNAI